MVSKERISFILNSLQQIYHSVTVQNWLKSLTQSSDFAKWVSLFSNSPKTQSTLDFSFITRTSCCFLKLQFLLFSAYQIDLQFLLAYLMAEIINAVAIVKVKPESKALAEELVKELAKRSRAEPGVIRYDIFRVNEKEGTYVFLEQYKSQEDFDIHRKSAHVQELLAATVEYLVEPPITVTLEKEPI